MVTHAGTGKDAAEGVQGEYFAYEMHKPSGGSVKFNLTVAHNVIPKKSKGLDFNFALTRFARPKESLNDSFCLSQLYRKPTEELKHWQWVNGIFIHKTEDLAVLPNFAGKPNPTDPKTAIAAYSHVCKVVTGNEVVSYQNWTLAQNRGGELLSATSEGSIIGEVVVAMPNVVAGEPDVQEKVIAAKYSSVPGVSGSRVYDKNGVTVGIHVAGETKNEKENYFKPIDKVLHEVQELLPHLNQPPLPVSTLLAPKKSQQGSIAAQGVPVQQSSPNLPNSGLTLVVSDQANVSK
jgi:hypothetical protein